MSVADHVAAEQIGELINVLLYRNISFGHNSSRAPLLELNTHVYVANNPLRWIDPTGLWAIKFSGYWGRGGSISFGREGGKWFFSGGLGVGAGGGFKYYPTGSFPKSEKDKDCDCGDRSFIGSSANFGASVGPASAEYKYRAGGLTTQDCDGKPHLEYYEKGNFDWSLRGKAGWGISLGGGINIIDGGFTW